MYRPTTSFMRRAILEGQKNIKTGHGGPFGACLVLGKRVIATARNTVLRDQDPTCHAEVNAIRLACRKLRHYDLSRCVIYSTTEPCPMCFAAIHWARIPVIIYGTDIAQVARLGFNELAVGNLRLKRLGKSKVQITPGFQKKACQQLLERWNAVSQHKTY